MTSISPIASTSSTEFVDTANSQATLDSAGLADDLDTFLTLLTSQLENQDPLEPMDTNQFVDQLTQFSELEQGVETNETLTQIANTIGADDRQADLNLLGTVVEVASEDIVLSDDAPASFAFEITSPTDDAEMRIFDQGGNLIAQFDVEGDVGRYSAGWDGTTIGGGLAGPGVYRAQVVAKDAEGNERLAGNILSGGMVREIRFEDGETQLFLDGGITVTSDDVRRVGLPSDA